MQNIYLDRWPRAQRESRNTKDKIEGFYAELTVFDKLLLGSSEKVIKKMYDYLLETKMQDEMVKECMIRWAQNIGHNVDFDHWLQTLYRKII